MKSRYITYFIVLTAAVSIAATGCKEKTKRKKRKEIVLGPAIGESTARAMKKNKNNPEFGYILYDPETGEVLESHNRNKTFIPASTCKIPTTVAALHVLGPDHRFKTYLEYTGNIDNGVLNGDLYLKGTGDPSFQINGLITMMEKMLDLGIKEVKGKFYYDESELAAYRVIDKGQEDYGTFNTGLSALSMHYNLAYISWDYDHKRAKNVDEDDFLLHDNRDPEPEDERKLKRLWGVYLTPDLPMNRPGVFITKDKHYPNFTYYKKKGREKWLLSTMVKKKKNKKAIPVKRPGLFTAQTFRKICRIHGIKVPFPRKKKMPSSAENIYTHTGRSVLSSASFVLTWSNNMTAEMLLLTTAKKLTGKKLTLKKSGDAVSEYLYKRMPKINWEGFKMYNGSGLTVRTRISPEQLLACLLLGDSRDYDGRSYFSLLPISGYRGTMFKRLGGPGNQFRVYAKTGGIYYAVSLAGYVITRKGRRLMFAFLSSNPHKRRKFDKLYKKDDSESDKYRKIYEAKGKAGKWGGGYGGLNNKLLLHWMRKY